MSSLEIYVLLTALTLAVCLFAMWKGAPAERWGGVVVLGMMILERVLNAVTPAELHPYLRLLDDALTAIGLLILALRFGSLWIGGAMLFYASQFALHSFFLVAEPENGAWLHFIVNNLNFAGVHVCLVVGTIISMRSRMRARASAASMRQAEGSAAAP